MSKSLELRNFPSLSGAVRPHIMNFLLMEGLRADCFKCRAPLCLRQQVLNLALGEEEDFLCLRCLAQENGQTREVLLERTAAYVLSRDCFKKPWLKYESVEFCPDREGCLPGLCFKSADKNGMRPT